MIRFHWMLALALAVAAGPPALAQDTKYSETRDVTYVERNGEPLKADIFVPSGTGPFPAVLVIHGGAWRGGSKANLRSIATGLAEHGYTACAISYRLAPQHPFPAQIEDCKAAIRFLRSHAADYRIDAERIGVFGYSAGGHLAALLGTTDTTAGLEGPDAPQDGPSTRVQAVVAGGAPCEFRFIPADNETLAYWLGGSRSAKPEVYESASPLRYVTKDDPPCFFFHGEKDMLVPLASPQAMVKQLKDQGVPAALLTVPRAGHGQTLHDPSVIGPVLEFLDKNLKSKKS